MAGRFATMVVTAVTTCMLACGLSVRGTGDDDERAPRSKTRVQDSTQSADLTSAPAPTFACGSATCASGSDVCCGVGASARCHPAATGCPSVTDGGAPAPAFRCTSSDSCPKHTECCFDEQNGASCLDHCATKLCTENDDNCGPSAQCVSFLGGPLGIGKCVARRPETGEGPEQR